MSSFVINKIEFVKAAGLMYGIEESKPHSFRYFLENVRDNFVRAFEFNALSVAEQYHDDESYKDELTYDSMFEEYRRKGRTIWTLDSSRTCPMNKKELRNALTDFFHSVLYQIENREMNTWVASFFWQCASRMEDPEVLDSGWWGKIEI